MPRRPGRRILLEGGHPDQAKAADQRFLRAHANGHQPNPLDEQVAATLRSERAQREREQRLLVWDRNVEIARTKLSEVLSQREDSYPAKVVLARRTALDAWERFSHRIGGSTERPDLHLPDSALRWIANHDLASHYAMSIDTIRLYSSKPGQQLSLLVVERNYRGNNETWDPEDNTLCRGILEYGVESANRVVQNRELLKSDAILQLLEFTALSGGRPTVPLIELSNYRQRRNFEAGTLTAVLPNLQHFAEIGYLWLLVHPRAQLPGAQPVRELRPAIRENIGIPSKGYDQHGLYSLTGFDPDGPLIY